MSTEQTPDTALKPYTQYVCPVGGMSLGHGSIWTGAMTAHRPSDEFCPCGERYVEEAKDARWRVSWESVSVIRFPELYDARTERAIPTVDASGLDDSYWHPTSRETDSENSARGQYEGLLTLMAEGEFIRNVRLERSGTDWTEVERAAYGSTKGDA